MESGKVVVISAPSSRSAVVQAERDTGSKVERVGGVPQVAKGREDKGARGY